MMLNKIMVIGILILILIIGFKTGLFALIYRTVAGGSFG